MKKIGIVFNKNKQAAHELLPKLHEWLSKKGCKVLDNTSLTIEQVADGSELIICLGGDGTLLSIASSAQKKSVPILGINMGALGFLTEVKQDEVFEELESYLKGNFKVEDRLMLSCKAASAGLKKERHFFSLNDMVVSREGLSRILQIEIHVSGEKLTSFTGDGVIIATPTGSTAYSLSAGGAVVHPTLEAILITPICPHASALRPIVVSASEKITVRVQSRLGVGKALLTADGQENLEIDDSYTIEVMRADRPLKLVKSSRRSYFATLRENFKFPS